MMTILLVKSLTSQYCLKRQAEMLFLKKKTVNLKNWSGEWCYNAVGNSGTPDFCAGALKATDWVHHCKRLVSRSLFNFQSHSTNKPHRRSASSSQTTSAQNGKSDTICQILKWGWIHPAIILATSLPASSTKAWRNPFSQSLKSPVGKSSWISW